MATPLRTHTLNNGLQMPLVGLGCWMEKQAGEEENAATEKMVTDALNAGYRHFDTASYYGNEEAVGKAIRASSVPRLEIFVTTKLGGTDHGPDRVAAAFDLSLKALGLGYIDLYLIHWPQATDPATEATVPFGTTPTFNETWAAMEKLLPDGKVKSIGVSNFSVKNLELLLTTAIVIPAVNQVQAHPYHPNTSLHTYCAEKGIHLTAYCPLGQHQSPIFRDPTIIAIANAHNKLPSQVVLSWAIQRGNWSVVPKSVSPERLAQNFETFELGQDEFEQVSRLYLEEGKLRSLCDYGEGGKVEGSVIGWTFEEMGWEKLD